MVPSQQQIEPKLEDLNEKGRGIYFYHASNSTLPVRDTPNKKEPYVEYGWENNRNDEYVVGAENYCYKCYQEAVRKLVRTDEQYLFLLTNPTHLDRERCIVGYLRKEDLEIRDDDRVAVIGETRLYSFDDAIPASEYGKRTTAPLGGYGETFDKQETKELLDHFHSCEDVTEEVLQEILRRKE